MNKPDLLFNRPSVMRDISRIFDFGYTNNMYHEFADDMEALKSDWVVTGNDMWEAINEFKNDSKRAHENGE